MTDKQENNRDEPFVFYNWIMGGKKRNGYYERMVRYEEIHAIRQEDFDSLVEALQIEDGHLVADIMCGYGAVAREVLTYANQNDISVRTVLVDKNPIQLRRSHEELGRRPFVVERYLADARSLPFPANYLDRAAIKMGLQELQPKDKLEVVREVCCALKPGGIFGLWSVLCKDGNDQKVFQEVIRKKDQLAGFDSLAENRYLEREDEIERLLINSGFEDIELVRDIDYRLSTKGRLRPEFKGDVSKLQEWNEYIRAIVPDSMKERLQYDDKGDTIYMTFRQGIMRAVKPKKGMGRRYQYFLQRDS
jgi:ubiquinone/menaquinone biosynthesis C-methylase UbiE